ncbi:hypothetical protein [Cohaesibacter celericrescens]|uniref:hypothetical protein n=1 Tax=Cohaesibacter celericrescens TaxID=2067669 RepID=UPI0015E09226|nr:hypothetical protein [Cohaesibacter celericrescens]
MPNRQARSPGKLARLETQGQVSTKPGFAVDANAGVFRALQVDLRRMGNALGSMADRAMKHREQASIEAGKTQGQFDGYNVDLGTGAKSTKFDGDLKSGIASSAQALGINPIDLATAISYETAGTFDPTKKGPTTQWGQHRGLIQFGEPQAKKFGVDWNDPIGSQLGPEGAVVKYLKNAGVKPGMGLLDIYSAINAGGVGKYTASDANNGGAPGTVRDKVQNQMAGHKAKAEKLFANQQLAGSGRPGPSGPALALRQNQSVMGKAYQGAQDRAISRRLPLEVTQQLDGIYEEYKDDPNALIAAFDQAEGNVLDRLQKLSSDPELLQLGRETFARKRRVYEKSAMAEEDKRVRDGERADFDEVNKSSRTSLQRQAYLVGDDAESGADLDVAMNDNLSNIEDALEAGLISPQFAAKESKAIFDTVTMARLEGVFDSLPGPDEKEAFVADLKENWTKGEELLKDLSLEQVQKLERTFAGVISSERRQATADVKLQTKKMQRLIGDDLTSIGQTGVGLAIDGDELSFDEVKSVLGIDAANEWQRKRQIQTASFNAVTGLDLLPVNEMMTRLEGLEPKPGSAGYVDQMAIVKAATTEAKRIATLRKEDPAEAVDQAFDELQPLKEQAYGGDLAAMEQLINGRMDAQETLGISDYSKAPLTNVELEAIARPLAGEVDKQAWLEMAFKLDQTYGPNADEVMAQIMRWKGMHKDVAAAATGYLRKLSLGEQPSRLEAKSQGEKLGALTSEQAMDGQFETVKWKLKPDDGVINALIANPDRADQFDEAFGEGAAAFYFRAQERSRLQTNHYVRTLSRKGISIQPDGSENYDPELQRRSREKSPKGAN